MGGKNNISIIHFLILAVIFGALGGFLGFLFFKSYIYKNPAYWSEINLRNQGINGTSLIIQGAKKVIIEQDEKLAETISSTKKSLVGIYDKKNNLKNDSLGINNYYNLEKSDSQGIAITSDGWILTGKLSQNSSDKIIVIDENKDFYGINKIVNDPLTGFSFLRLDKAKNLPVRPLAGMETLEIGKTVFIQNWKNEVMTAKISSFIIPSSSEFIIQESDFERIMLDKEIEKRFYNSSVFDLEGNIAGFVSDKGEIIPAYIFNSSLKSILSDESIIRPKIGVKYLDLGKWADSDGELPEFGALIYNEKNLPSVEKGSAADIAGLKTGDVILSLDNITLNNKINLSKALSMFSGNQKINFSYWRNGEKFNSEMTLGVLNK
jgi:serine protease Do